VVFFSTGLEGRFTGRQDAYPTGSNGDTYFESAIVDVVPGAYRSVNGCWFEKAPVNWRSPNASEGGTSSCELTPIDTEGKENENGLRLGKLWKIKMNSILCKYSGLTPLKLFRHNKAKRE